MAQWWAAQPQQHWLTAALSARLATSAAAAGAPSQRPLVSLLPSTVALDAAVQALDDGALQRMSGILAGLSQGSTLEQVCIYNVPMPYTCILLVQAAHELKPVCMQVYSAAEQVARLIAPSQAFSGGGASDSTRSAMAILGAALVRVALQSAPGLHSRSVRQSGDCA